MSSIERIPLINPAHSLDWNTPHAVIIVRCECRCAEATSWFGLVERVLRSRQMTLRLALLLAIVLTGAVVALALRIA